MNRHRLHRFAIPWRGFVFRTAVFTRVFMLSSALSLLWTQYPPRSVIEEAYTRRLCSLMASKKRTWPRRTEAADPRAPNRRDNGGHTSAKTSFPPSPRKEPGEAGGDAERRKAVCRPLAIEANDTVADTREKASDVKSATNARNHDDKGSGDASEVPLRGHVDAASLAGQRIETTTGGAEGKMGRSRGRFSPSGGRTSTIPTERGKMGGKGRAVATGGEERSAEVVAKLPSSPRLRHPQDPGSPETAYRKAVQVYLAPPAKTAHPDASNVGDRRRNQNESHRQSRSLSPAVAQRSRWCSPVRPPDGPNSGPGVHGSASVGAGASAGPSSVAALSEKEGVPPLLLAPAEWGIGLGGEWVSARGAHTSRAVGRVSLTWADIRGNTLLHLAAQHNDVALVQAVLECEKRRKEAMEKRESRRERVLERARVWSERNLKAATERKITTKPTTLTTKDILRRIKEERAEQEKTTTHVVANATPAGDNDDDVVGLSNKDTFRKETSSADDDVLRRCACWLPLTEQEQAAPAPAPAPAPIISDGGRVTLAGPGGQTVRLTRQRVGLPIRTRGAVVVEALRAVLEEAHVRQVVRLAGMYLAGNITEAEWYHRTEVILPRKSSAGGSSDLLVDIAAAHPFDTYRRRIARAAIQDYAEEERSNAEGGFWMDRGINDALDLNARNRLSETPLVLGAQNASVEVVAALLEEAGTDITALNADGCTALVMAAMLNKTAVVKVLVAAYVARGLGVDHRTANGFSALHWAVVRGNADTAIDLVDAGAAVNTGRTERRQALWRLPIHKCAEYGSAACLQVLLKAGADPLVEDKLGMTPMHIAAGKGFLEIMQILSTGGEHTAAVSVNVVSKKNGKTPLHYAVESLQLEASRYILGRSGIGGDDGDGSLDGTSTEARGREAEGIRLLDASQRTKLEMMLAAAAKEERGVLASSIASLSEFVQKIFL